MNLPPARHRWNLTPQQAIRLQKRLAAEILETRLDNSPRLVAGGDAGFTRDGTRVFAGWIVWDLRSKRVIDTALAVRPVRFPYVPGLLSFREAPALIAAARKLKAEPDVFMFDGQGLAHPRRFGLASHVGLLIDRPSVGCAKTRLCGTPAPAKMGRRNARLESPRSRGPFGRRASEPARLEPVVPPASAPKQDRTLQLVEHNVETLPPDTRGASCPLIHNGELIGRVLRTRQGVKPIYVSVGHRITLADAVRLTLRCCTGYRLPEPTRLAHQLVTQGRREA